jgi:hypothetical protein
MRNDKYERDGVNSLVVFQNIVFVVKALVTAEIEELI